MFGTVLSGIAAIYILWVMRRRAVEVWRNDPGVALALLWALVVGPALVLALQ